MTALVTDVFTEATTSGRHGIYILSSRSRVSPKFGRISYDVAIETGNDFFCLNNSQPWAKKQITA